MMLMAYLSYMLAEVRFFLTLLTTYLKPPFLVVLTTYAQSISNIRFVVDYVDGSYSI